MVVRYVISKLIFSILLFCVSSNAYAVNWDIDDGTLPTLYRMTGSTYGKYKFEPLNKDSVAGEIERSIKNIQDDFIRGNYQSAYDTLLKQEIDLFRYQLNDSSNYFVDSLLSAKTVKERTHIEVQLLSNSGNHQEAIYLLPSTWIDVSDSVFSYENALLRVQTYFSAGKYEDAKKVIEAALKQKKQCQDSISLFSILQYDRRISIYDQLLSFRNQHRKARSEDWKNLNATRDSLELILLPEIQTATIKEKVLFEIRKQFYMAEANWHALEMTGFLSYLKTTKEAIDSSRALFQQMKELEKQEPKLFFDVLLLNTKVLLERPNIKNPISDYIEVDRNDPLYYDSLITYNPDSALEYIRYLLSESSFRYFPSIDEIKNLWLSIIKDGQNDSGVNKLDPPIISIGSSIVGYRREILVPGPRSRIRRLEEAIVRRVKYEGQKKNLVELGVTGGLVFLLLSFSSLFMFSIWKSRTESSKVEEKTKELTAKLAKFAHEKEIIEKERVRHSTVKLELETALQETDIVENDLSHRVVNQLLGIVGITQRLAKQAQTPEELSARLKVAIFEAIGLHRMLKESHQREHLGLISYLEQLISPVRESLGIELVISSSSVEKSRQLPASLVRDIGGMIMELIFLGHRNGSHELLLDVNTKRRQLTLRADIVYGTMRKNPKKLYGTIIKLHNETDLSHLNLYLKKLDGKLEHSSSTRNGVNTARVILNIPV
jgi:hypothetical protein